MGTDPVGLPLLPLLLAPNSATFFFPTTFFFWEEGFGVATSVTSQPRELGGRTVRLGHISPLLARVRR